MASKQISPASQLLRHSQLFSIPAPIRQPVIEGNGTLARNESDTATKHYPTHAAIIATHRGKIKGDWGLKRNLPIRKTATRRNPIFQMKAIDNIDHYTDYEQATPHAIALRKFQEMNVPITKPEFSARLMKYLIPDSGSSVFDVYEPTKHRESTLLRSDDSENAQLSDTVGLAHQKPAKGVERWKFKGPWLAGMHEAHFKDYLNRQVMPKRAEFKKFVWSWIERTKAAKLRSEQLAAGEPIETKETKLTEAEYETELVKLRYEGRQLFALMWEFLDLPGRPPSETDDQSIGPPRTHPSAGLSYLRTHSTLQNHPALGPMREHQPVLARVLQKANAATGTINETGPAIGIAGFVGNIRGEKGYFLPKDGIPKDNKSSVYGEMQGHVVPRSANIDERGRVNIDYVQANKDSISIWEGVYDAETEMKAKKENEKIEGFTTNELKLGDIFKVKK